MALLLLLAGAWALFLLPPWLQNRGASMSSTPRLGVKHAYDRSTIDISRATRIGQGARPSAGVQPSARRVIDPLMPASAQDAARRRRNVLIGLGGLTLFTLMVTPVLGAPAMMLALISGAACGGFGYLVVVRAQREAERREKVRPLHVVEIDHSVPTAVHVPLRRSVGI